MSKKAIEVKSLAKSYGKLKVLKGVSFSVETGSIMALLGPNGAGKTTTVKILATLLQADSGKAKVGGLDVESNGHQVRSIIGLTGQFAAVDEYLTGRENVEMIGKLYHLDPTLVTDRASDLLKQLDLTDAADRPARTYSGGMKRRLDLAMSLVAKPSILFLDEPTTGLDPRSRLALWDMIKDLAKAGTTILLTTQYMEEADYLAKNIIVLDHGVIIAEGTPAELKAKAGADRVSLSFSSPAQAKKATALLKTDVVNDTQISLPAKKGVESLQDTLNLLKKNSIKPDTAAISRPTLDDVFLTLTGHTAEVKKDQEAKK
jgi:ABC-2 type transport system ATP-binding protein